ncbi:outer membrane protein [Pedobacter steynii]|uniref:Outer membrane protein n=1 Tax=Pedobacter steynii TaxID=430522 RepID=A0A1G9S2W3_9SPHI|nr:OmpH family outer membrane protein [Pedobacter steynii]NQX37564.1 OmpH family outer membrane protein [Pedobacter steynii]SDM29801.1 outer membrane protein [Pedobacter steynii]
MNKNFKNGINVFTVSYVFVVLLLLFLLFKQISGGNKIAYIDSMKIYNDYKGIKEAKVEFEKKVELYKSRTDTLSARVKIDMMKIDQNRNDKARYKQLVDSVRFHKRQLSDYQSSMMESLKQEESKLTQKAMIKLNEFLKEYGNKNGYDMILIANPSGTIAFSKEKFDITDQVLKAANEKL